MYNLDIILDKSEKPKLSGVKSWQVICTILSVICIVGIAILANTLEVKTLVTFIISLLTVIIFLVISMITSEKKFKKKNSIHGIMELGYFNGKEVGVFKSQYNEVIMIDFENIISGGRQSTSSVNGNFKSAKITNKNTTVLYGGQLIKCAIALIIEDTNLLDYMCQQGYIVESDDSDDADSDD